MEPVEINAGEFYLRTLRADDLLDDRPALVEAFADPAMRRFVPRIRIDDLTDAGAYVALRTEEWSTDERVSWAVAEPTTGNLLGEVGLMKLDLAAGTAEASVWTHPAARGRGIAVTSLGAVLRFGFGALDLTTVEYRHARSNEASAAVAEKLGFAYRDQVEIPDADEADSRWTLTPDYL